MRNAGSPKRFTKFPEETDMTRWISLSLGFAILFAAGPGAAQDPTTVRTDSLGGLDGSDCPSCLAPNEAKPLIHEPLARVWPVAEPDLLSVVETLAASPWGEAQYRARHAQTMRGLARWADDPAPAGSLPKARRAEVRLLRAPFDFTSSDQSPAIQAAFDGFSRNYLFIDAQDPAERAYAFSELDRRPDLRVVVLAGSLTPLREARPNVRFYFDQGGAMRRLLRLTAHPSRVQLSAIGAWVQAVVLDHEGRPSPENDEPIRLPEGEMPVPADVRAAAQAAQARLKARESENALNQTSQTSQTSQADQPKQPTQPNIPSRP